MRHGFPLSKEHQKNSKNHWNEPRSCYRDNKISPLLYPSVIYKVAKEFNEAYVLVEINTSEQVAEILYNEYEYENIVFVNRTTNGQIVSDGFGGGKTQLGVIPIK